MEVVMSRSMKLVILGLLVLFVGLGYVSAKDRAPDIQQSGVYEFEEGAKIEVPVSYVEMYPVEIVGLAESDQPRCDDGVVELIRSEMEALCC